MTTLHERIVDAERQRQDALRRFLDAKDAMTAAAFDYAEAMAVTVALHAIPQTPRDHDAHD